MTLDQIENLNLSKNNHSISTSNLPLLTNASNENSPRNKSKGIITFDKYSPRKDIFKNSEIPILTYIEPKDILKDNKFFYFLISGKYSILIK